ncbi:MAG: restriction endonuclease subunit S [Dermatophilaceae bacterium]|nr:restriction endonuclease subunit S [Dermatophilaceae bacterium]
MQFYSGGTPSKADASLWRGDIPWFSAKDVKRSRLTDSIDHLTEAAFSKGSLRRLPIGTVVMVVRGMILAHTVPIAELSVEAAINQDLKALIPRARLDSSFLAAMLRAQQSELLAKVSTAAHGTKKLDSRVLEEVRIPVPPIEEQRRIAAILDHADSLRHKRDATRDLLAALVAATFREAFPSLDDDMLADSGTRFGDVVARLEGGRNLVAADMGAESPFRVLKISSVTSGFFRPSESKPLPAAYVPEPTHLVQTGDLLMSRANTTDLVGATALVEETPPNLALPDKVWRLVWHDPDLVDPVYMAALLQSPPVRRALSGRSSGTGGSMKNISKAKLMDMPFPVADFARQCDFAARAKAIRSQAARVADHRDALDLEFLTLQARAFSGRL